MLAMIVAGSLLNRMNPMASSSKVELSAASRRNRRKSEPRLKHTNRAPDRPCSAIQETNKKGKAQAAPLDEPKQRNRPPGPFWWLHVSKRRNMRFCWYVSWLYFLCRMSCQETTAARVSASWQPDLRQPPTPHPVPPRKNCLSE